MMQNISQLKDIAGKKVLLRADFDVAVAPDGTIREAFRVQRQRATIDYLISHGAQVLIVAHISATPSFTAIARQLGTMVGQPLSVVETLEDIPKFLAGNQTLALLDNVRRLPGEEQNDDTFAAGLASGFDYYVNNAFAVCHRNHASVSAITQHLPAFAGLLVQEEVTTLDEVTRAPATGKIIIVSGAKGETKVPVLKHLLGTSEYIIVGGAIAHDILKLRGQDIGASIADANPQGLLAGFDIQDPRVVVPIDFIIGENKFLDIGEQSVALFNNHFRNAKFIVWNGPFGAYEDVRYGGGTLAVARAVLASGARTVIGGGDTIAALDTAGLLDKFGFISTGGGAMLVFLARQKLPGLEALGYYTP